MTREINAELVDVWATMMYERIDKIIDLKPKDLQEVKDYIYNCLVEKYGRAVISNKEKEEIVIDTQREGIQPTDVWIKLNYFN